MKRNRRIEDVRLVRNGIIRLNGKQYSILDPEHRLALGRRAFVRWDPEFPSKISVFNLEGNRLVCEAPEAKS